MTDADALVIGGSRFIGRHTVAALSDAGYDVTTFNRGNHEDPFGPEVDRVQGDRREDDDLERAASEVAPDVVVDCVAYYPRDVRVACEVFADVDAYVFISSGAAYGAERTPKREDETPLHDCTDEQVTDDTWETYGNRKAEADRRVFRAADRGVNAMSLRPPIVYGPHDYTERFDYWVDRIDGHDRVLVPGDGTNLRHLVYVEDVAEAVVTLVEAGEPGEAYNCGDDHLPTLGEWVGLVAEACDAAPAVVHAGARELDAGGLTYEGFPLYRASPHVLDTTKLRDLGWRSTPHEAAVAATVEHVRDRGFDGERGPARDAEERVLDILETM
jgi:Nucleoside-diphosphate-sugar epimerases